MSVINQLLLDLEKRRVSGAERNALPGQVRALPEDRRELRWGWIAACGAAVALVAAWALFSGLDWARQRGAATMVAERGTEIAIEKVLAASAGVILDGDNPGADSNITPRTAPASRLSFELSNPPAQRALSPAPLPTARVVGRTAPQLPTGSEASTVASERIEPRKPSPAVATPKVAAVNPEIRREVRQPTVRELAEGEYRKATALLHQGNLAEAQEGFQAALTQFPGHSGARQALVGLLLEAKKYGEAERVLKEGLTLAPAQSGFTMTLARLQVDRGEADQAIDTLKKGLEFEPVSADYLAFLAALLQRQGRHEEAIEQYQGALRLRPAAGVWWLGLGISLQSAGRLQPAQDAYRRAHASNNLNPELAAFAEQRLKQLQ